MSGDRLDLLQRINDLEKALDKACSKLSEVIDVEGCNMFCGDWYKYCNAYHDCSKKDWWKERFLQDE